MGKGQDAKKTVKKAAVKTAKEKRQEKKDKKPKYEGQFLVRQNLYLDS